MDGITEMAKLFKERNNPSAQGICIGNVIMPPPALEIAVNNFVLDKSWLVVAQHLLPTYKRETEPTISVSTTSGHTHTVKITDITFTDTLTAGDKVIVIPSVDNLKYYIIDKVGDL